MLFKHPSFQDLFVSGCPGVLSGKDPWFERGHLYKSLGISKV